MVQLSAHFALDEFQLNDPIPAQCIPMFARLCQEILEPARAHYGDSFRITSGYRSPEANAEAHGQPNSEHMATENWCACDFVPGAGVRELFDWMRNNPTLPFNQLILEHGQHSTVIHVSINRLKPGVRSVLEGATHNAEPYIQVDHVAYQPPQTNAQDVLEIGSGNA